MVEEHIANIRRYLAKADACINQEDIEDAYCQALEELEAMTVTIGGMAEEKLSRISAEKHSVFEASKKPSAN